MPLGIRVNCTLAAILIFLLAPRSANTGLTDQQGAESAAATSHGEVPTLSSREKAGLRGPVEECTVETISQPRDWRQVATTKYDPDGRIYQFSYINNDGSKGVESLTYDTQGHLLTATWDGPGGRKTIYTYDAQDRVIGITGERDRSTTFEYDNQGRKTRIVKSELKASSSSTDNRGGFGFVSDNDDLSVSPPAGGLVKTSFNERDQPIESQVYTASGDLLSRLTRTYDAKGRVAASSYMIENFESLLSPEARERLAAEPGASEEMKRELVQFLGDQRVFARISYIYDDEGRVVEKHERIGPSRETITKITYNDHGDKMEEIATTSGELNHAKHGEEGKLSSNAPESPSSPLESDVRFSYQYDSFGNWIEETGSFRSGANESFRTSTITRRTITYY